MSLAVGTRIGPYEITGPLGAGGMGEVYRARDQRLGRDVALKVLPDTYSTDPDRLARFQREAQVLASLKHPNIGAIYGLEDGPAEAGHSIQALVLELIEGETLAERLAPGPIPVREALPLALQIADALEAAHEQGIIHRDLKPANVRITPDGAVKVLDFGLAKLAEAGGAGRAGGADETRTASPALTSPALLTGMGMMLGTAAYMAPEQAKGRAADKRSDIWAFGCVLYEMLTGVSPFKADDVAETIALVLTREPDMTRLPSGTPLQVRRLLQRALEKDRRHRLADAGDARLEIEEAIAAREPVPLTAVRRRQTWLTLAAVLAAVVLTAVATWFVARPSAPASAARVARLTITPSVEAPLAAGGTGRSVAITPDGSRVVYRAAGPGLVVRALDQLEETPIPVGNAAQPFVSPDGEWIGFFDGLQLKKVPMTGGPSTTLSRLDGPGAFGASWGTDGRIIFATASEATGLQQVSADGGAVTVLTKPDRGRNESDHVWPSHLPGDRGVLFTITPLSGELNSAEVAVLPAGTTTPRVLVRGGTFPRYVDSGHLVYLAGADLRAIAFDLDSLEVTGDPVTLSTGVRTTLSGAADFDVATDGTLVYVAGGSQVAAPPRTVVWIDRGTGQEEGIESLAPGQYNGLAMSPDGTRVAVDLREQGNDIWIWDVGIDTFTRLTFGPSTEWWPVWMPKGDRLVFGSTRAGTSSIYAQAADGSGSAERLATGPSDQLPTSVSPDGMRIVYDENSPTTQFDVMSVALDDGGRVIPLLQTSFNERYGSISPNGRWVAYQSDETGREEIYVRPFPNTDGGRWQVSPAGGVLPVWSPGGDELFYMTGAGQTRQIMAVRVGAGASWIAGRPVLVAEGGFVQGASYTYAVARDGRILVIKQGQAADTTNRVAPTIVVVQNWLVELRGQQPPR